MPGYTWRTTNVFFRSGGEIGDNLYILTLIIVLLSSVKLAASAPLMGRQDSRQKHIASIPWETGI